MLAEENKNAGTSALEGKEVLQCFTAFVPSYTVAISWSKEEKEIKEQCSGIWNETLSLIKSLVL